MKETRIYCDHCGKEIDNGSRFCTFCGGSQQAAPAPAKKSVDVRWIIAFVWLGLAVLGWILALFLMPAKVMDEPAAGLDPQARLEFKQLVRALQKQGKTLLISSHILSELAEMCDTMIFMDKGRIIRKGSQDELLEKTEKGTAYNIRPVGDATPLLAWLAESDAWHAATLQEDGSVQVTCKAEGDAALAQELQKLCAAHPVTEFARSRKNLEETFVNILQEQK